MRATARRAPDPALKSLDGQTHRLSALRGKIVVVSFWATWCAPCQEELPRLAQIAASYAGKPVEFVLVSIDDAKDRAKLQPALDRLHVPQQSWIGGDTDLMGRFGLGDIVPATAILDQQGEIVARIMGEARENDLRQPIDWLLAGKAGPTVPALTKRY
ncbi:TlpA family protein disulfide reductase [Acidobacteria bacterium AB60]|nr:TlpA family protein disulfide reductase [Acidobacteria bacterium AB60]